MNGIRVFILVFLLSISHAQTVPSLHGRVEGDSVFLATDYTVELEDRAKPGPRLEVPVTGAGSFEFRNLASAQYVVRLLNRGEMVCEQYLDAGQVIGDLTLRLPSRCSPRPGPATVSVRELLKPVPDQAFRAFVAAQHFAETGRGRDAVRKLEQAVQIFPEYSDARSNLGQKYA